MKRKDPAAPRSTHGSIFPVLVASNPCNEDSSANDCTEVIETGQAEPLLLAALLKVIQFDERRLALVNSFIERVVEVHDPDTIETFLSWKAHPVLDTILHLSATLDEESQYEVLNCAEDLAREAQAGATRRT